jgi:hypothetical protein
MGKKTEDDEKEKRKTKNKLELPSTVSWSAGIWLEAASSNVASFRCEQNKKCWMLSATSMHAANLANFDYKLKFKHIIR